MAVENEDSDLFDSGGSGHRHTIDGSNCPTCNKVHQQLDFADLSETDQELLLTVLDRLPDEMVDVMIAYYAGLDGQRVPPHADFLRMFLGKRGIGGYDTDNKQGPMLRAVSEVLDHMTNGEVTRRFKVYEAERQLVVSHQLLKILNNALASTENAKVKGLVWSLEFVVDFMVQRLNVLSENYRKIAAEMDMPVDQQLIDCGIYTQASNLTQTTMLDMMEEPLDSE